MKIYILNFIFFIISNLNSWSLSHVFMTNFCSMAEVFISVEFRDLRIERAYHT